jgi:hypothetical protein
MLKHISKTIRHFITLERSVADYRDEAINCVLDGDYDQAHQVIEWCHQVHGEDSLVTRDVFPGGHALADYVEPERAPRAPKFGPYWLDCRDVLAISMDQAFYTDQALGEMMYEFPLEPAPPETRSIQLRAEGALSILTWIEAGYADAVTFGMPDFNTPEAWELVPVTSRDFIALRGDDDIPF